jgi:Fe-S-cluster containining protein
MDQKEIGKIFYRDGFRLAIQHLGDGVTVDGIKVAIKAKYEAIDGLLEAFLQRAAAEGSPAECKNGCAFCCFQPVFAVSHEMLYLKDYIKKHLPADKQEELIDRSRKKSLLTLNKSLEEQQKISFACPFLDANSCMVYEARPMSCRIYLSSSVSYCKREFEDEGNSKSKPELYEFPLNAGRMLNEGFVSGLKQMGLQSVELPLEHATGVLAQLEVFGGMIKGSGHLDLRAIRGSLELDL